MDSSRTGAAGLTSEDHKKLREIRKGWSSHPDRSEFGPEERKELQDLRADDRSCEAQGLAPAAEKIARRLELDARERAAEAQGRVLDAMRGLRTLRVVLGLSLREVADAAGLEHVRLGEIERGVEKIAADDEIRAICGALGGAIPRPVKNCEDCALAVDDGCFNFCHHPDIGQSGAEGDFAEYGMLGVTESWRDQVMEGGSDEQRADIKGLLTESELGQRPVHDECPLRRKRNVLLVLG